MNDQSSKRPFLAGLMSAILPGCGQWYLEKKKSAGWFFGVFIIILLLYWLVRVPSHYFLLILTVIATVVLFLWSSVAALTSAAAAPPASRWWLCLLIPVAVLGATLHTNWVLRASGYMVFEMPSSSMETTLRRDDRLMADLDYFKHHRPSFGEVSIFKRKDTFFVKRIMAVGGQTIASRDGRVFVDGKPLDEKYVQHNGPYTPELMTFGPVIIPSGKLFVMGDNRDVSLDSRMTEVGLIDEKELAGKPLFIIRSKDQNRNGQKIE